MEFTKDVIKEFWSKEFKSRNFSFRRQDWIPDKYNTVAHYPDSIMQKTVEILDQFFTGVDNEVTRYIRDPKSHIHGWYLASYATEEERKEIGTQDNLMNYFFGSKKYEIPRGGLLPVFGDLIFYRLFGCKESPVYIDEDGGEVKFYKD